MKKIGRIVCKIATSKENPRNGEGAFAHLKDGGILFAYSRFGGAGDDHDSCRLYGTVSYDGGESWSAPKALFDGDENCRNNMSPTLLRLKDGSLGLCYLRKHTCEGGRIACMPVFRRSFDEGKSWGEMIYCVNEPGYYVGTNDASVVFTSGRIVTPVSYVGGPVQGYEVLRGRVRFLCSDDCGSSWFEPYQTIYPPYDDPNGLQEPGILELEDGRLWSWMRTLYGYQYQSFSNDSGASFSVPAPNLCFSSPDAPMRVRNMGKYAVAVFNPVGRSVGHNIANSWGGGFRSPLAIAVSKSGVSGLAKSADTFNWRTFKEFISHCALIEDDLTKQYCYPSLIETGDGFLVAYYYDDSGRILNQTRIVKVTDEELKEL